MKSSFLHFKKIAFDKILLNVLFVEIAIYFSSLIQNLSCCTRAVAITANYRNNEPYNSGVESIEDYS